MLVQSGLWNNGYDTKIMIFHHFVFQILNFSPKSDIFHFSTFFPLFVIVFSFSK